MNCFFHNIHRNILKDIEKLDKYIIRQLLIFYKTYKNSNVQLFQITMQDNSIIFNDSNYKWNLCKNPFNINNVINSKNAGSTDNILKSIYCFFDILSKKEEILIYANMIITIYNQPTVIEKYKLNLLDNILIKEYLNKELSIENKIIIANDFKLPIKKRIVYRKDILYE